MPKKTTEENQNPKERWINSFVSHSCYVYETFDSSNGDLHYIKQSWNSYFLLWLSISQISECAQYALWNTPVLNIYIWSFVCASCQYTFSAACYKTYISQLDIVMHGVDVALIHLNVNILYIHEWVAENHLLIRFLEINADDSDGLKIVLIIGCSLLGILLILSIVGYLYLRLKMSSQMQRLTPDHHELTLQGPILEVVSWNFNLNPFFFFIE